MLKSNKQKVIDISFHLFSIKGIQSTSLHDIATECCVSPKQLKESFESKKVIVESIIDQLSEKMKSFIQVNPKLSPNAFIEMKNFLEFISSRFKELKPALIRELKKYYAEAWNKLVVLRDDQFIPCMKRNIQRGIAEGVFVQNATTELYSGIYFMMLSEVMQDAIKGMEQGKIIATLNTIFFRGILTIRGQQMIDEVKLKSIL